MSIELFKKDIEDNCDIVTTSMTGNCIEVRVSHSSQVEKLMRACGRYEDINPINSCSDVYGMRDQVTFQFESR